MREHKAESLEQLLKWWPELQKLTEHTGIVGIRFVVKAAGGDQAAFEFGDMEPPAR